ncbi:MAG: hypothetical protein HYX50_00315 [Chloroflexi bacterium]|nr:hypothetical protein [Chloroflexota bacterium]
MRDPRPAADLRSRHDLGEIVGYAYRLYAAHFLVFFAIALVTLPLQMLYGTAEERISSAATSSTVASLFQIPIAVVSVIAGAAIIAAVRQAAEGTRPTFMASLDSVFERLWTLFSTLLLTAALAAASVFAFPLLGLWWLMRRDATVDGRRAWWMWAVPLALTVYLLGRWVVAQQMVIIEDRRNWSALDASATLVRGQWWRVIGIVLVIGLIQFGPLTLSGAAQSLHPLPAAVLSGLIAALVLPFGAAAQTLLYYDLKARREPDDRPDGVPVTEPDLQG